MEEKDLNLIVDKLGTEVSEKFASIKEEFAQNYLSETQFQKSMDEFAKEHDIKGLSDNIEKMALNLKKMEELKKNQEPVTLKSQLEPNFEKIQEAVKSQKSFIMDLKTDLVTTAVSGDTTGTYIPGFGQAAYAATVMEGLFAPFNIASGRKTVYWQDQATVTRNADTRAENSTLPESALSWIQRSASIEKILDSIPMSMEAMADIEGLLAEVQQFLRTNMALKIDAQLWNGNDATPNWNGIYAQSTDFSAALVSSAISAGTVAQAADASTYDLLMNVITYISNGKESKYSPNLILMNPVDILKAKLKKDGNDNYIIPPFVSRNGMMVEGANIEVSPVVTANTLVVGDSRFARYYNAGGVELEFGFNDGDFAADKVSLKARKRGQLVVRNIDATAFYKVTDIATRISNINV